MLVLVLILALELPLILRKGGLGGAILGLIGTSGEVTCLARVLILLDLSTDIVIGRVRGLEDGLREGGGGSGEDTLVGGRVVTVIVVRATPSQSTEVQVESLLGVHVWIHGERREVRGCGWCCAHDHQRRLNLTSNKKPYLLTDPFRVNHQRVGRPMGGAPSGSGWDKGIQQQMHLFTAFLLRRFGEQVTVDRAVAVGSLLGWRWRTK